MQKKYIIALLHTCVFCQAFAGQRNVEANAETVYSLCDSEMSNTLSVMCPAPPTSPVLRLESMDSQGIDVTWTIPQQYGDAQISVSLRNCIRSATWTVLQQNKNKV